MDSTVKTRVIKRNGEEVSFDLSKIISAISKANREVDPIHRMNEYQIMAIAEKIAQQTEEAMHAVNVEDIQNMVETRDYGRCAGMRWHRNMCATVTNVS